jgi:hypothetical protein
MEKKRYLEICLVLIIISLFLVGCEGMRRPGATRPEDVEEDVHHGTRGLRMEFARNLPPPKMFDTDALTIMVEMENRGSSDLTGTKCYLHLAGFDQFIFPGLGRYPQECGMLEERSIYNPDGGFDNQQFSLPQYSIFLPEGIDSLKQRFVAHACYYYETKARPIVCLNPRLYDIRAAEEACIVKDVSMAGGQGAPIAVSNVEVYMMKDKVMFTIHVSNSGGGAVFDRHASRINKCPYLLGYEDLDVVDYRVDIESAGAYLIDCKPQITGQNKVRLNNGKAKIICTFGVTGNTAFTTPLKVDLYYNYLDSISKEVEVIKTPR